MAVGLAARWWLQAAMKHKHRVQFASKTVREGRGDSIGRVTYVDVDVWGAVDSEWSMHSWRWQWSTQTCGGQWSTQTCGGSGFSGANRRVVVSTSDCWL